MSDLAVKSQTRDIVVDEVLPHSPEMVWKALTTSALIGRWLMMTPNGLKPEVGTHFTYQTTPAGEWDGTIHCEVLEVLANERFAYTWKGGHEANVAYGSPLDTVVTFMLSKAPEGTRLRVVHSGFVLPTNETAFRNMSKGWASVVPKIGDTAAAQN